MMYNTESSMNFEGESSGINDKIITDKGLARRDLVEQKLKISLEDYYYSKLKLKNELFKSNPKQRDKHNKLHELNNEMRTIRLKKLEKQIAFSKDLQPRKAKILVDTSKDFPLQTRVYIRTSKNIKFEDSNNITLLNLAAFKPGEKELKPLQNDLIRKNQLEKIENKINDLEKHRLSFVCKWIVKHLGPDYINLVSISSLLKILPVALSRFWFKAMRPKINKNPILLSAYKNAQYFCSICNKYVCNLHYEELEDESLLIQTEEPDLEYSPFFTRYTCAKFKKDDGWHLLYKCPYKLEKTCQKSAPYLGRMNQDLELFEVKFIKDYCLRYGITNPCMIRLMLNTNLTCQAIAYFIKSCQVPKLTLPEELIKKGTFVEQKKKGKKAEVENNTSWKQYLPCYHPFESCENCPCQARGNCEIWCGCAENCPLKFQGCKCKPGQCKEISKCPCVNNNRECDPEICKNCRCDVNMKLVKKYDSKVPHCTNTGITYGVKQRLLLGKSEICDGMGLFTAKTIQKGDYLGTYVGELIENSEGSLRGLVYNIAGCSYMFDFDEVNTLDSYFYGNKMRFINHGILGSENVIPKFKIAQGSLHIGFYAIKPIDAGSEILFNYGDYYKLDWLLEFNEKMKKQKKEEEKSKRQKKKINLFREEQESNIFSDFEYY